MGQQCSNCLKFNHFARTFRTLAKKAEKNKSKRRNKVGKLSSAEESDSKESSRRSIVGKLGKEGIAAIIPINGTKSHAEKRAMQLATDTGVTKTLLDILDWLKIKLCCKFVKTSKQFRPFDPTYHVPTKGKGKVNITADKGTTQIDTLVYILNDEREQSLIEKEDALS